jgi:divalent anion:Na+ symporter, DASS family
MHLADPGRGQGSEVAPTRSSPPITRPGSTGAWQSLALRWVAVLAAAVAIASLSPPAGVTVQSWRLLAIFAATILGLILQPLPAGAMVLIGVTALAFLGVLTPAQALAGWADPIVWLVLAAFAISRGMIKTGLGRRIALVFIRVIGGTSLGLGYALAATDATLAMVIPSNGARAGGIVFPITKSLAESYDSRPGPTASRLGSFLMTVAYHSDVIICAMFLTGQASNVLIAGFAKQVTGIELTYTRWALGAAVPGIVSLLVLPLLLRRICPPEITRTPGASAFAAGELRRLGAMSSREKVMLLVFAAVIALWMTTTWHRIDYTVIALAGVSTLLVTGVLAWEDVLTDRPAWDVFVWYGGMVLMARMLGETGITKWFAQSVGGIATGWPWWSTLAILLVIYFYSHYAFASITAHASAMYIPFLTIILAAGAPPLPAALSLACYSNLDAALTHYGTTPAPIYFGAGYLNQRTWWKVGLLVSFMTIPVWAITGIMWWKLLGWW